MVEMVCRNDTTCAEVIADREGLHPDDARVTWEARTINDGRETFIADEDACCPECEAVGEVA